MYNIKDANRRAEQADVINKFKSQQKKAEKEEIFNDDREDVDQMFG
jgi:hypothetical protein